MAVPHFDAQLSPGPHISHNSPDLNLVHGDHTVGHNLHEVLKGLGLDSPDLCLTDTPTGSTYTEPRRCYRLANGSLCCQRKSSSRQILTEPCTYVLHPKSLPILVPFLGPSLYLSLGQSCPIASRLSEESSNIYIPDRHMDRHTDTELLYEVKRSR